MDLGEEQQHCFIDS